MNVFIIGAGTMGSGIAQVFASKGFQTVLCDKDEKLVETGYKAIKDSLNRLVKRETISQDKKGEILLNITKTTDKTDAAGCHLIIEAVVENIEIKKALFGKLEQITGDDAIFATNTSSLSVTEIAAALKDPGRLLGMHFFNPAPLMKLVEIIKGINSRDDSVEKAIGIVKELDKEYVVVNESCGFIVNRILIPMINEATGILAEGIASAEDIDKAMKFGANHPMGPLSLGDMIGNDIVLAIMNNLFEEFGDSKYRPHPLLKKMVRAGHLGRKTGIGFFKYQA
ncbi:MAG TPA: 3-hydroxyacyl-CoA dehydrogenase NAD-binding domain-containing protein [Candidatus Humimicrobiaceae bacterium]